MLAAHVVPVVTGPFVVAAQGSMAQPTIGDISPAPGTTGVPIDTSIAATPHLPNSGLDSKTVNSANVYLYRTSDHSIIPSAVNTSGGGDSIVLQPRQLLAVNTQYTFVAASGVKDTSGASLVAFHMTFTTGTTGGTVHNGIAFKQVALAATAGLPFTDIKFGPDGKLYASTEDGRILKYTVASDGTLGVLRPSPRCERPTAAHD